MPQRIPKSSPAKKRAAVAALTLSLAGPAALLPGLPAPAQAQAPTAEQTIAGKVTDNTGQPLPGVTVLVKGTSVGA